MPLPQLGGCHTEQLTLRCRSCFWRSDWRNPHARRAGATLMMVMPKVQIGYSRRYLQVLWKICWLKSGAKPCKSPEQKVGTVHHPLLPLFQTIHLKWMPSWFKIFLYQNLCLWRSPMQWRRSHCRSTRSTSTSTGVYFWHRSNLIHIYRSLILC